MILQLSWTRPEYLSVFFGNTVMCCETSFFFSEGKKKVDLVLTELLVTHGKFL